MLPSKALNAFFADIPKLRQACGFEREVLITTPGGLYREWVFAGVGLMVADAIEYKPRIRRLLIGRVPKRGTRQHLFDTDRLVLISHEVSLGDKEEQYKRTKRRRRNVPQHILDFAQILDEAMEAHIKEEVKACST